MTQPDFEQLAQDYLDFVKKSYRVVFPIPDNASEEEILRGSRSWPGPMDISSPLGEVDRAYFPQLIEAIAGLVKQQYNSATARALGYRLCIWMMGSDGRTPALLEGNYGQCMAAIEQNCFRIRQPVLSNVIEIKGATRPLFLASFFHEQPNLAGY